jgi:hypothetical protein
MQIRSCRRGGQSTFLKGEFGAVAQLGERYVRNVQAGGSIPLCSIKVNNWQRAKRGVSGALYPEPAIPGPNPHLRLATFRQAPGDSVERTGLAQRTAAEPRQDRKVAAVSGFDVWCRKTRL